MKWYEIIVCILGAVGGLDFLKWAAKTVFNRKNNARIADSEADISEFHVLQEQVLFLQTQLKEKEERFAEQTTIVRKQNLEIIELTQKLATAEIEHAKEKANMEIQMAKVKCEDIKCPFRLPPNAYTPSAEGVTKESYFKKRNLTDNGK